MENVRGLIFDLDNTLINYGGVTRQAWRLTCKQLVKEIELDVTVDKLVDEIIKVNDAIWEDEQKRPKGNFSFAQLRKTIVQVALANLNIINETAVSFLVNNYAKNKQAAIYVFPDVKTTLIKLKQRGYLLALLTNGDSNTQREKLKRFDLESLFDGVFIDGEMGVGKPDKQAYQNVLNLFNLPANQVCMIGDHYLWEVVAPKRYGLKAIWVNRGPLGIKGNEEIKADHVIKEISELLKIFK